MTPNALPKGIHARGEAFVADVSYRGRRRTGTADSLEEAVLLKRELLADLRGQPVAPLGSKKQDPWTLDKAISVTEQVAWRGTRWGQLASFNARQFAKFVGKGRTLDTLDLTTLDAWAVDLSEGGNSDATINRKLASVSKVFSVAHDRGGTPVKPKIPRRKESQGRIRYLTPGEEAAFLRLFRQWGKDDEADLFTVLIDTGLRVGEALALEERDVDFKSGVLTVWRTKNDTPRSVPMTKRVRATLEGRAAKYQQKRELLPVSRHAFRQTWDRAKSHLGLGNDKQLVPHALRHTTASRLIQRGVALKVVQDWLGHKSIVVTMRYAHLAPANLMAAVSVLEEAG